MLFVLFDHFEAKLVEGLDDRGRLTWLKAQSAPFIVRALSDAPISVANGHDLDPLRARSQNDQKAQKAPCGQVGFVRT